MSIIDTAQTIEVRGSPMALVGLMALGLMMTGMSLLLVLPLFAGRANGDYAQLVGLIGALFFGTCTTAILYRLLTSFKTVLVISPDGIRDTRVAADVIPWSAIQGISTWEMQGQKVMILEIDPDIEARLTLTWIARWSRGPNRSLGADGLAISAHGLKISFQDLLTTSIAYAEAYKIRDDRQSVPSGGVGKFA
ncbi:MAG: STM3941 family protein [Pseudomonadota bacterium]